jgi:hypothetical protein
METTKNKLSVKAQTFFNNLSEYLDIKLLYFGSIQRLDYFPGKSDIDVDVFTENEHSTILKMQQFLKKQKTDFKKVVWRLRYNRRMVYGHKVTYKDPNDDFTAEFSIYNDKFKEDILVEHLYKTVLPFYVTLLLLFLKTLHYNLGIISTDIFIYLKKKMLSVCLGMPDDEFIVY